MKQLNPPISRAHRAISIARAVFLITIVAGVACFAARGVYTSRASRKVAASSLKAHASGIKTSLTPPCTTDPIVVNNSDSGAGSLRQAITDACDASTITFNMTLVTSPITLTTAELSINKNLTITGPGSSLLTIARSSAGGTPNFRIFNISAGTVSISGVNVTNGKSANGAAGVPNGAKGDDGGGIRNIGTLTMSDVGVIGNTAGSGGNATSLPGNGGDGGGIYNSGSLEMTNCIVSGNYAGDSGGGGNGGGGGGAGDGGGIYSFIGTFTLTNVTIQNNHGGASTAVAGTGGMGGGILSYQFTIGSLTNCTVTGNSSGDATTGIDGYGGGIFNESTLTIVNSTISNNTSNGPGGAIISYPTANLTLINSTISGNSAADVGGILDGSGTSSLTNCTITNNSALTNDGMSAFGNTKVRNTIIAGNGAGADLTGTFISQGNNLIGKSNGSNGFTNGINGDQVGSVATPLDPRLGPLANNGGPTQTHGLLADSTAIDAGNNCVLTDSCSPALGVSLTTDQRGAGFGRSTDGNGDGTATADIGAYEVGIILVTNTDDSGPGSLRQAITDANVDADTNAIIFQAGLTGTITLLSALPDLSTSMSINGPGANLLAVQRSTAGGTPNFRIFKINSGTTVAIRNLTISNGKFINSGDFGAGVLNNGTLTLANCNIYGNQAMDLPGKGGGIYSDGPSLVLNDCNIGGVSAGQPNIGGGIVSVGTFATLLITGGSVVGNTSAGIFFAGVDATLTGVSITNNTGTSATGGFWTNGSTQNVKILNCLIANNIGQNGGGLRNAGGTHLVMNTTISGNTSLGFGGGLDNAFGNTTLINVTITNNRAQDGGGVFNWSGAGQVLLNNTVVAGNFRGASASTTPGDITNLVSSSSSFSLIGSCDGCGLSNGVNNNQVGVADPRLAVLANYGGPTQTHALLPSSPALNAGSNALATNAGLTTDQRGFARITNTTVDIGSFESRGFTIAATSGTPQSAPITTAFGSFLVATVSSAFGEPVAGGEVIFTAPSSGASGTFPGSVTTASASINASGLATAPTFTANAIFGGPYNVVASLAGGSPSANFSLTNLKGNQTITVNTHAPASAAYNSQFTVAATASSGLAVTYSSSGACTNSGATFTMTSGDGTCTVKYDQGGSSNYNAAPQVIESVTAQKANQTITVNTHAPASAAYNSQFTVAATASSGLAVTYSSSGACTNSGATFTMTSGDGTCTVKYDQGGSSNYNAATQVTESVTAQKANQTITVNTHAPASATYNSQFTVAATASSGLAVTYSSSGACTNSGATFTMTSGDGTCTVKYDQGGNTNYNAATQVTESVTAQTANQTITVNTHAPASAAYNSQFTVAATASSGLAVTYSSSGACTNSGATFTMTSGDGTCTVKYDQGGSSNYNAAPQVIESVTAQKANQTITVNTHAPASAAYNSQFTVAATASSGLAVTYSSSGACTNSGATFTMTSGDGTCTVKYDQGGSSNYNAATQVIESVTAQKANQTITFTALANKTFGDADFNVSASASSSLAVSFTASGQCTITGTLVHLTGAGSCTITATQGGNDNYSSAPDVPQAFNIGKAATATAVSSSVNPSEFGQSVTFTATVSSGAGTPTGTVQFKDGAANIGSPQTVTAGVAQLTTTSLTSGLHTITADYSGDINFAINAGTLSGGQMVNNQPTLSISDVSIAEGNSGTANLVFTISLSAASNIIVNVDYSTSNGTATTADNDYQSATNTITFNPTQISKTITVLINGDQKFEPDETLFVNLTNAVNAAVSDNQGLGTILNDDSLQLILDASGPDANQLLALESVLFVRDPFRVRRIAEWLNLGADQNTRVIVFAANLQLNQGETAAAVAINLIDGNGQSHNVTAEQVAPLPNSPFTQVIFRLPDNLSVGTCQVTISAHGQTSNAGTFRIVQ